MRSKMSERIAGKKQKKAYVDKMKHLQKMVGEALENYEKARTLYEKSGLNDHFHDQEAKFMVVKRIFTEMDKVSQLLGKSSQLVGNFYIQKHSVMESSSRNKKGLQGYYVHEFGIISPQNKISTTSSSFSCNDLTATKNGNRRQSLNFNPYTPHKANIIALDDYEIDIGAEDSHPESPFDNIDQLMKYPAHVSVFFHYLISNSNPSPLCLLFLTSDLMQPSTESLNHLLYSLYCTFLQEDATLKVDIDKETIIQLKRISEMDKSRKKKEEAIAILSAVHDQCKRFVSVLLEDFKSKRLLGLGSLFGDRDLSNNMNTHARDVVIERSLWPHFDAFSNESWSGFSLCMVSCIVTFFKMVGFSPLKSSAIKKMDSYTVFRQRNKSTFSTFPRLAGKAKVFYMKDHYFEAPKYSSEQNCHHCGRLVCSVGDCGLSCMNCQKHFHKACANMLEFKCELVKRKIVQETPVDWNDFSHVPGMPVTNKSYSTLYWNVSTFKTLQNLRKSKVTPTGSPDAQLESIGDPTTPVSLMSSPVFHQSFGTLSSIRPYPEEDFQEEVTLRDTLCINRTTDGDKEFKKKSAVEEIVYTENNHVRCLKVLYNVHYIPMMEKFPREFVSLVFPNLQEVISIHDNLKNDFKTLMSEKSTDCIEKIAKILLRHFAGKQESTCKVVFATFIERRSHALQVLKARQENDGELDKFIKERINHPLCRRLSLQDFLPKVMQRITKYPILIQNLIKHAQDCSPSTMEKLEKALVCVQSIIGYVNSVVNDFEMRLRLEGFQKRMVIKPVDKRLVDMPYFDIYKTLNLADHKLLYDGSLRWEVSRNSCVHVHVVLLEDMIVLLRMNPRQASEAQARSFGQASSFSSSSSATEPTLILAYYGDVASPSREGARIARSPIVHLSDLDIRSNASDKKSFYLLNTSRHGPQIYTLVASTQDEKKRWWEQLESALHAYRDRKYKPSFYFGVESKKLKFKQKDSGEAASGNSNLVAPTARSHEISRNLSDFSDWVSNEPDATHSERSPTSPVNGSSSGRSFGDYDAVFDSPQIRRPALSVDDLDSCDRDEASVKALHSMYTEFNKFAAALGEFLAENGTYSSVTSLSPRQLKEWSNQLHIKFKDVLKIVKKSHPPNDHPMLRSFSEEVTAA